MDCRLTVNNAIIYTKSYFLTFLLGDMKICLYLCYGKRIFKLKI